MQLSACGHVTLQGEGVCCFILAGSGSIDAFRASRVLPHLLHLSLGQRTIYVRYIYIYPLVTICSPCEMLKLFHISLFEEHLEQRPFGTGGLEWLQGLCAAVPLEQNTTF